MVTNAAMTALGKAPSGPRPTGRRAPGGRPVGPRLIAVIAVVHAGLWLLLRDSGTSWRGQIGELLGAQSVLALSVTAVLAVGSARVDDVMGGPGRRQAWHRASALVGLALVLAHLPVVVPSAPNLVGPTLAAVGFLLFTALVGPAVLTPHGRFGHRRGPLGWVARMQYDRWKLVHRLTAAALLAGMGHGLLDSTALARQPVLAAAYLAICAAGASALAYQLVIRRTALRGAPYRVGTVRQETEDVRVITLLPEGRAITPAPGQYVDVDFEGVDHGSHPFTVTDASPDGAIQIAVKASGDDTRTIHAKVGSGARAWIQRPRGDLPSDVPVEPQVWVAAGIGITPFLRWIRTLPSDHPGTIDLWYTVKSLDRAPFLNEIRAAAGRSNRLKLHLVITGTDSRITARRILSQSHAQLTAPVFLCGPRAMVAQLSHDLRAHGWTGPIHHESFSPR